MTDPTYDGTIPWSPPGVECFCGHMNFQHHDTGRKRTYCTVWSPVKCPCERFTP